MSQSKNQAQQPQLQHKTLSVVGIKSIDKQQGIAELIVSVFNNIDRAGDRIKPGFFAKSLKAKLPKGVWMHDWTKPIAITLAAKELLPGDEMLPEKLSEYGGLYVKVHYNLETQRGKEAFSDLCFGTVDEFSIGFLTTKEQKNEQDGCNDLIEGELFEWSPVLVGCNQLTQALSMKAAFLGQYVEVSMTIAAIGRLNDRLMYGVLYEALLDEEKSLDEKLTHLTGAFDEFRDIALKAIEGIMRGAAEENPEAAAKSLQTIYCDPDAEPRDGLVMEKNFEMVLAAVKRYSARVEDLRAKRASDGRTLSEVHTERLATLSEAMETATGSTKALLETLRTKAATNGTTPEDAGQGESDNPASEDSDSIRRRIAARRASLREKGISLTPQEIL